ncbi:MAG: CFI-box-CTERM domain-containing protein [Candidatus Bathyarchaeia archaeon]
MKVRHALPLLVMLVSVLVYPAPRTYGLDRCAMPMGADPSLELVATITLDKEPESIAVNEETNLVYVGTEGSLIVIDGGTNEVVTEVPLWEGEGWTVVVRRILVNPQTNRIYAASAESVKVIDGATHAVVGEIPESALSREIAINPATNLLYIAYTTVTLGDPDVVRVYDGTTLELVTSVEIPGSREPRLVQGVGVAVNPRTNRIYATWTYNDNVYVIDGNTHQIAQSAEPSSFSIEVTVNPATNHIYIGNVVLDGETLEEVASGRSPPAAINPVGNLLYITVLDELRILDGSTYQIGPTLELDEYSTDIAVNPKTGMIYLAHRPAKKISVVQGPLFFKPAEFAVSGLTVQPEEVDAGRPFKVTVNVSNTGYMTGSYNIELEFAGEVVDSKTVTLSPGESTTVTFEVSEEEPGTYTVRVNGETGTVTIHRLSSSISCYVSPSSLTQGETIVVYGSIGPPFQREGAEVTLAYTKPDGTTMRKTVTTGAEGSYRDPYTPDTVGSWSVEASWEGDAGYKGATSSPISFEVKKKGCVIATATYGSELAPEVQFLRGFRDGTVLSTFAGSQFMAAFNAWYYSFSPSVATLIVDHPMVKVVTKAILCPLIGILHLSAFAYSALSFSPELGIVVAGLVASSLIGVVYFSPLIVVLQTSVRRLRRLTVGQLRWFVLPWFVSVTLILAAEILASPLIMMSGTVAFVLLTISLAALTVGNQIVQTLE